MRLCVYTRLYVICTSLADGSSVICTCARILITLKFLLWNYIHTYIILIGIKVKGTGVLVRGKRGKCGGVFILRVPHLQEPKCGFSKQVVALLKEEGCVHKHTHTHTHVHKHYTTTAQGLSTTAITVSTLL